MAPERPPSDKRRKSDLSDDALLSHKPFQQHLISQTSRGPCIKQGLPGRQDPTRRYVCHSLTPKSCPNSMILPRPSNLPTTFWPSHGVWPQNDQKSAVMQLSFLINGESGR
jgi:hypothetical protein